MKEETKREQKEKRQQEKKDKKRETAILINEANADSEHTSTIEVLMKPTKAKNSFEYYILDDNNTNGSKMKVNEAKRKSAWKKLDVDQKVHYENLALDDRLRYQHEMELYQERVELQK